MAESTAPVDYYQVLQDQVSERIVGGLASWHKMRGTETKQDTATAPLDLLKEEINKSVSESMDFAATNGGGTLANMFTDAVATTVDPKLGDAGNLYRTRGVDFTSVVGKEIKNSLQFTSSKNAGLTEKELTETGSLLPNESGQDTLFRADPIANGLANKISSVMGKTKSLSGIVTDMHTPDYDTSDILKEHNKNVIMSSDLFKVIEDKAYIMSRLTGDPVNDGPLLAAIVTQQEMRARAAALAKRGVDPYAVSQFNPVLVESISRGSSKFKSAAEYLARHERDLSILIDGACLLPGMGILGNAGKMAYTGYGVMEAKALGAIAKGSPLGKVFSAKAMSNMVKLIEADYALSSALSSKRIAINAFELGMFKAGEQVGGKYFDSPMLGGITGATIAMPAFLIGNGILNLAKLTAEGKGVYKELIAQKLAAAPLHAKLTIAQLKGQTQYMGELGKAVTQILDESWAMAQKINTLPAADAKLLAAASMANPNRIASNRMLRMGIALEQKEVMQLIEKEYAGLMKSKFGAEDVLVNKSFQEAITFHELSRITGLFDRSRIGTRYEIQGIGSPLEAIGEEIVVTQKAFTMGADDAALAARIKNNEFLIEPISDLGKQVKDFQLFNDNIGRNLVFNLLKDDSRFVQYTNPDGSLKAAPEVVMEAVSKEAPQIAKTWDRLTKTVLTNTSKNEFYGINVNGVSFHDIWERGKHLGNDIFMPKSHTFRGNKSMMSDLVYNDENLSRIALGLRNDLDKAYKSIYKPLSKDQREVVNDILYQANLFDKKVEINGSTIMVDGTVHAVDPKVADALKAHNLMTDYMFQLTNAKQISGLASEGFLIDSITKDIVKIKPNKRPKKVDLTAAKEKLSEGISPEMESLKTAFEDAAGVATVLRYKGGKIHSTEVMPMDTVNSRFRKLSNKDTVVDKVEYYSPIMYNQPLRVFAISGEGANAEVRLVATAATKARAERVIDKLRVNIATKKEGFAGINPETLTVVHTGNGLNFIASGKGIYDLAKSTSHVDFANMKAKLTESIKKLPKEEQEQILQQVDAIFTATRNAAYNTKGYAKERTARVLGESLNGPAPTYPVQEAMDGHIARFANDFIKSEERRYLTDKFLATYGDYLDDPLDWASKVRATDSGLKHEINVVQRQLKTIMGYMHPLERVRLDSINRFSDWASGKGAFGDLTSKFMEKITPTWVHLPQEIKKVTGSALLGMLNVSSGVVQAAGALTAIGKFGVDDSRVFMQEFLAWYTGTGLKRASKVFGKDIVLSKEVATLHNVVKRTKIIEDANMANIFNISNEHLGARGMLDKFESWSGAFLAEGERINRVVALFAERKNLMREIAAGKGVALDGGKLSKFEIDNSQRYFETLAARASDTSIAMNKTRNPEAFKDMPGVALQFRQYPMYWLDMFTHTLNSSQKASYLGLQTLMFGIHAIPFAGDMGQMYSAITGKPNFYESVWGDTANYMYESDWNTKSDGSKRFSLQGLYSMGNGLGGVASNRMGHAMLLGQTLASAEKGIMQTIPAWVTIGNALNGIMNIKTAYKAEVLTSSTAGLELAGMLPLFSRVFKGERAWEQGVYTDRTGKNVLVDLSKYEAIQLAAGFTPERIALVNQQSRIIQGIKEHTVTSAEVLATTVLKDMRMSYKGGEFDEEGKQRWQLALALAQKQAHDYKNDIRGNLFIQTYVKTILKGLASVNMDKPTMTLLSGMAVGAMEETKLALSAKKSTVAADKENK